MTNPNAFCANCGNAMDGRAVCARCGTVADTAIPQTWAPPASIAVTVDTSTPTARSRNFLIPVVAIVCVGALVAFKVYDSRDSKSSSTSPPETPVATNTAPGDTSPGVAATNVVDSTPESGGDSETRITQPPVITASIDPCPYPLQFVDALPWGTCTKGFPVQLLQDRLVQLGYQLDADSYFGPETEIALIQFQRDNFLDETGIVDLTTWTTLFYGVDLPGYDYNNDGVITPDEIVYD